jgi:hypothetical protein
MAIAREISYAEIRMRISNLKEIQRDGFPNA